MFLDILELRIKNKTKIFRENCFENVVSDLEGKKPICPQNYFYKNVQKLKTQKT